MPRTTTTIETFIVTNQMYALFMKCTNRRAPLIWPGAHPQHPVLGVSQFDAEEYCKWVGSRLPTYEELPEELLPYWWWTAEKGMLRGKSWLGSPSYVRGSLRDRIEPTFRYFDVGFRCVGLKGLPQQEEEAPAKKFSDIIIDRLEELDTLVFDAEGRLVSFHYKGCRGLAPRTEGSVWSRQSGHYYVRNRLRKGAEEIDG